MECKKKPNCCQCVHVRNLPGNAHKRCNNVTAKVVGDKHGINNGWFLFPFNYDPIWLVSCDGFSDDPKDDKPTVEYDAITEIMSILR